MDVWTSGEGTGRELGEKELLGVKATLPGRAIQTHTHTSNTKTKEYERCHCSLSEYSFLYNYLFKAVSWRSLQRNAAWPWTDLEVASSKQ